jgi:NodT family efflux transporter outer membrane factor (OMF) lipoprotein
MKRVQVVFLSAAVLMSSGCAVKTYQRPIVPLAPSYDTMPEHHITGSTPEISKWWERFNDPELNGLIDRACKANLDLRQATDRVNAARATAGITRADFFPSVNASVNASRNRIRVVAAQNQNSYAIVPIEINDFQGKFDMSWELDVFGRVRSASRAARADVLAAGEQRNDVLVSVVSEVARYYMDLRGTQLRLSLANENIATDKDLLELTRARFAAGLDTQFDVARAEAQSESVRPQVTLLQSIIATDIYRISVLVGEQPLELQSELSSMKTLPSIPSTLFAGLPSDLLQNRPDIRRAEQQMIAQTARVSQARSEYFPRFMLTGSAGRETSVLHDLTLGAANVFSVGPSVSLPVFTAGRVRSNVEVQRARASETQNLYRSTVLLAVEETQGALTRYANEQDRLDHLNRSVAGEADALELARVQYKAGLTDFLSVRDAERELYARQDEEARSRTTLMTDVIAVYKALGGMRVSP